MIDVSEFFNFPDILQDINAPDPIILVTLGARGRPAS